MSELGPSVPDPSFKPPDLDFLFLLFTNRCGSNYLAQALASTGRFNEAGEFFNADVITFHAKQRGLRSFQEYFTLLPHLVASNGRLVAKLGPENIDILHEAGILRAVQSRSRFILLERQDRLGQAISRLIASQDLRWTSEHACLIPQADLVYARVRIDEELRLIEQANQYLYHFLSASRIAPLHFAYEALIEAPQNISTRSPSGWHCPTCVSNLPASASPAKPASSTRPSAAITWRPGDRAHMPLA
jgi:LPS sulfotransferase NodH